MLVVLVTTFFHSVSQVSSTASRISVPRLSVGAVSSRPSTPTLGEGEMRTRGLSVEQNGFFFFKSEDQFPLPCPSASLGFIENSLLFYFSFDINQKHPLNFSLFFLNEHRNTISQHKGWDSGVPDGSEVHCADPSGLPDNDHKNQ